MRLRNLGLVVGLIAVALAFWVLLSPGDRSSKARRERSEVSELASREEVVEAGGGRVAGIEKRVRNDAARTIRGRILDENGVAPEEGTVLLFCAKDGAVMRGPGIVLDEEGRFESEGCGGSACVRFQHPSLIQDGSWVLEPGVEAELRVRSLKRLEGKVIDEGGEAVAGARVLMLPEEEDPTGVPPFVSRHAGTDADGMFSFYRVEAPPCDPCGEASGRCDPEGGRELPLSEGAFRLTVRARGYRNEAYSLDSQEEGPVEIVLHGPEAPLRGTLRAPDGAPYSRAAIFLRSQSRPQERHRARVDGETFEFRELGEGLYDLDVVQDGIALWREEGVKAGAALTLRPKAAVTDVLFRFKTADGRAIAGATIRGGPFKSSRSDERGRVKLDRVAAGFYSVTIEHSEHGRVRREVEVQGGERKEEVQVTLP